MRQSIKEHAVAIALLAIAVVGLVLAFCAKPEPPVMPEAHQHSFDSLRVTAPIYHAERDTLIMRETTYVARSVKAHDAGQTARQQADSIAHRADSLETLALAANDSAALWHATADERKAEAERLLHANDSLSSAWLNEHLARIQADARASLDSTRNVALTDLNTKLAADVAHDRDCHVLRVLTCPSRIESYGAGFVTGTLAVVAMTR